jgi:AmmeMemoRadiSam system protein A
LFDEQIVDAIARGDPSGVINIDPELRNRAGECGYRSIVIALGAVGEHLGEHQVLSYEGPFGVGYMVAVLAEGDGDILPQQLARLAVEAFISRRIVIDPPESRQGVLAQRAGTFVTLRTLDGSLRGCMGTIEPGQSNVAEEIIQNAISAATRDPRFPPILTRELTELTYSVDVLSTPGPARGPEDLDPAVYGVIIETLDGRHRGLLLPGIDGIASVEDQWRAVHSKAWIEPGTPVRVERFTVTRFGKD